MPKVLYYSHETISTVCPIYIHSENADVGRNVQIMDNATDLHDMKVRKFLDVLHPLTTKLVKISTTPMLSPGIYAINTTITWTAYKDAPDEEEK